MNSAELGKNLLAIVNTLIPILAVLAVYKGFEWNSKRKTSTESEKVYAALDRLWPFIKPECMAEMVTNEPEAYTTLAAHIANRQLKGIAKGLKL